MTDIEKLHKLREVLEQLLYSSIFDLPPELPTRLIETQETSAKLLGFPDRNIYVEYADGCYMPEDSKKIYSQTGIRVRKGLREVSIRLEIYHNGTEVVEEMWEDTRLVVSREFYAHGKHIVIRRLSTNSPLPPVWPPSPIPQLPPGCLETPPLIPPLTSTSNQPSTAVSPAASIQVDQGKHYYKLDGKYWCKHCKNYENDIVGMNSHLIMMHEDIQYPVQVDRDKLLRMIRNKAGVYVADRRTVIEDNLHDHARTTAVRNIIKDFIDYVSESTNTDLS